MSAAVADVAAPDKEVSTAIAKAALAGFELVRMADGSFVVGRWGMVRSLEGMAAVQAFLVRVGALA
ncbi:MAG: hypothetical protein V4569_04490 [Pseudomonadota bacterium]